MPTEVKLVLLPKERGSSSWLETPQSFLETGEREKSSQQVYSDPWQGSALQDTPLSGYSPHDQCKGTTLVPRLQHHQLPCACISMPCHAASRLRAGLSLSVRLVLISRSVPELRDFPR